MEVYRKKIILVTGGNGLLGTKLIRLSADRYEVHSIDTGPSPLYAGNFYYHQIDITQKDKVLAFFAKNKFAVVFHTAALTGVDYCQTHQEDAWRVNVEGSTNMVQIARKMEAKFIFLSTDYVFDGKNGPYKEGNEPNPAGYYGLTKWEAEKLVKEMMPDYIIARTAILYGYEPHIRKNFVLWVREKLSNKESIKVVNDQYGNPTLADNLARVLLALYEKDKRGIYHTTGREIVNRYDFACGIADKFGLNKSLITPVDSAQLNQDASRPLNSGLNVEKAEEDSGLSLLNVEEGLEVMKAQIYQKFV